MKNNSGISLFMNIMLIVVACFVFLIAIKFGDFKLRIVGGLLVVVSIILMVVNTRGGKS